MDVELDVDVERQFGFLKGVFKKSAQVLLDDTEAVLVLILIFLK